MLPLSVDIVAFAGCYFVLMLLYTVMEKMRSHPMGLRLVAAAISYSLLFFMIDYGIGLVRVTVDFYETPNMGTVGSWMISFVITGLLFRLYIVPPEKLNVVEMQNFVRASVTFGNYFRLRDVDTQERIGKHKMKAIYEEVHGKPFQESELATPFDEQKTTIKRVGTGAIGKRTVYYPPEFADHSELLKTNRPADVSSAFRFELAKTDTHPFLQMMERFVIDPGKRSLSFEIVVPLGKKVAVNAPADKIKTVEQVYESLQHLIAQEWLPLYLPYFGKIIATFKRSDFSEENTEISIPIMTFSISVKDLQLRATRITTGTEITKISQIQFL